MHLVAARHGDELDGAAFAKIAQHAGQPGQPRGKPEIEGCPQGEAEHADDGGRPAQLPPGVRARLCDGVRAIENDERPAGALDARRQGVRAKDLRRVCLAHLRGTGVGGARADECHRGSQWRILRGLPDPAFLRVGQHDAAGIHQRRDGQPRFVLPRREFIDEQGDPTVGELPFCELRQPAASGLGLRGDIIEIAREVVRQVQPVVEPRRRKSKDQHEQGHVKPGWRRKVHEDRNHRSRAGCEPRLAPSEVARPDVHGG